MGYTIRWKSKTLEGRTFVPTPKAGWVKSPRQAREWFHRTKGARCVVGKPCINMAPKTARIISVKEGGSYKVEVKKPIPKRLAKLRAKARKKKRK